MRERAVRVAAANDQNSQKKPQKGVVGTLRNGGGGGEPNAAYKKVGIPPLLGTRAGNRETYQSQRGVQGPMGGGGGLRIIKNSGTWRGKT